MVGAWCIVQFECIGLLVPFLRLGVLKKLISPSDSHPLSMCRQRDPSHFGPHNPQLCMHARKPIMASRCATAHPQMPNHPSSFPGPPFTLCSKLTPMMTGRVLMERGHSDALRRRRSIKPHPQTLLSYHKIPLRIPLRFPRTTKPRRSIHLVPSVTLRRNCWKSTKIHTT